MIGEAKCFVAHALLRAASPLMGTLGFVPLLETAPLRSRLRWEPGAPLASGFAVTPSLGVRDLVLGMCGSRGAKTRSHECERCTQECVRHVAAEPQRRPDWA